MPKVTQLGSDRAGTRIKVWIGSGDEILITVVQGSVASCVCHWAGVTAGVGCEVVRWEEAGVRSAPAAPTNDIEHM